jgi:transcriptional regulator with XRE-family HTH domain
MSKKLTELGKILRKIRIDNNLSMEDMALIFDISISYLSLIETGKRQITQKIIKIILINHLFKKEKDEIKKIILNDYYIESEVKLKELKKFFEV